MWHEIHTENELRSFMEIMYDFHDSCVKELRYVSGAYVEENLGMYPVNDRRVLRVIIQRQFEDIPMLELEFGGIKYLHLVPVEEKYTCEIRGSSFFYRDGFFFWYDEDYLPDMAAENIELNGLTGTAVCASSFRWRKIENGMGPEEYYCSKDHGHM